MTCIDMELDDVVIRNPISDNPADWIIPASLRVSEATEGGLVADVFTWWEKLQEADDFLADFGGFDSVLHEMRIEWHSIYGAFAMRRHDGRTPRFDGHNSHLAGYRLIGTALRMGLTLAQTANLYSISQEEAIKVLHWNRSTENDDVSVYVLVDSRLREASMSWAAIGREAGISEGRVATYAEAAGILPTHGGGRSLKNPPQVKAKALELLDQGMKPNDIVAWIHANMPEGKNLTASALYQWAHRSNRTTPKQAA